MDHQCPALTGADSIQEPPERGKFRMPVYQPPPAPPVGKSAVTCTRSTLYRPPASTPATAASNCSDTASRRCERDLPALALCDRQAGGRASRVPHSGACCIAGRTRGKVRGCQGLSVVMSSTAISAAASRRCEPASHTAQVRRTRGLPASGHQITPSGSETGQSGGQGERFPSGHGGKI